MPFSVKPKKEVDIDFTDADPDDFLEVQFEDDSRLYVRMSSDGRHLVLDEQLLPPLFGQYLDWVVERVLQCTGSTRTRIERVFAQRAEQEMTLEEYVRHRVCHQSLVSAVIEPGPCAKWREFNIGDRVRVQIAPYAGDWHLPFDIKNWIASSKVASIKPIDRHWALANFQIYPSPGQAWPPLKVG